MNDVFTHNGLTSIAGTVDGCHPNDLGFGVYAANLYRELSKYI